MNNTPVQSASLTVTLIREDFESLLKLAHGDSSLPSASNASLSTSVVDPNMRWLIDFRASDHMTGNPYCFSTFIVFSPPRKIILADERSTPAMGQ